MNIIKVSEIPDLELNTLFNAIVEEKARRKENQKIKLWDEFCAICTKIREEGFDIDYYDEYFEVDKINIY